MTARSRLNADISGLALTCHRVYDVDLSLKREKNAMPRAVEVFTPNDLPTFTYVERATRKFEDRLRESLAIPKMIISLSGPSKSGKTVLVNKVIEADNLIPLSGASIRSSDDLWIKVLNWMDVPTERTETTGSKFNAEVGGRAGGAAGIPFVAQGKAEVAG